MKKRSRQLAVIAWSVGTVTAAAAVGRWGAKDADKVYSELDRPRWAPPGWLFAPAWGVLYAVSDPAEASSPTVE